MDFILFLAAGFILLLASMLVRTTRLMRFPEPVEPVELPVVDKPVISSHLSEAISFKTISREAMAEVDYQPFLDLHQWIFRSYPKIGQGLKMEVINKHSLLLFWQGSEASLQPVLFNAHMDVVPVAEDTLPAWTHPPFQGVIQGGYVWGRGALDMKCHMVGLLDAVESLLAAGYTPRRSIYLSFGHDEEIMGFEGARRMVDYLKSKSVQLAAVLDEGSMISQGLLPGVHTPVALIGVAEKGYATFNISAKAKPGHSSMPPRQTAIGIVSRAIALLDDHPMPSRLDILLPTLMRIGHLLPFWLQVMVANSWLFKPLIIRGLQKNAQTKAVLQTTHAATMIQGGIKDNILPASAIAKVNCRLLPGDSLDAVIQWVKQVVNDPRVEVSLDEHAGGWEASRITPTDSPAYRSLELVMRQVFDNVTAAPMIFLAATDSRHFQPICSHIFKFSPFVVSTEDFSGVHGINERISQDSLAKMGVFYSRLMRVWGDAGF